MGGFLNMTTPREEFMHQEIMAMIMNHDTCVLATVSGAEPHCSLMSYAAADDGREIYLVSHKNTKKSKNIEGNSNVSLLIDSRAEVREKNRSRTKALTITGVMEKVQETEKSREIAARLLARHPHLEEFLVHPEAEILVFRARSYQLLQGVADAYYEEA